MILLLFIIQIPLCDIIIARVFLKNPDYNLGYGINEHLKVLCKSECYIVCDRGQYNTVGIWKQNYFGLQMVEKRSEVTWSGIQMSFEYQIYFGIQGRDSPNSTISFLY